MIGILQRQILKELLSTTLLGLVGISLLMTLVLAMVEAGRHGLAPLHVLLISPFIIPTLLPYTLPTCLLFSCVVVYGGMAGANEITALKAAGINILRVIWPAVLLGVLLAGAGVYLTDRVIPACNQRLHEVMLEDIEAAVLSYIKTSGNQFSTSGSEFEVIVKNVKGNKLVNPIFVHKNPKTGETDFNISASEAELKVIQGEAPGKPPRIMVKLFKAEFASVKGQAYKAFLQQDVLPMPIPAHLWKDAERKLETLTYMGCLDRAQHYRVLELTSRSESAYKGIVGLLNGMPLAASMATREVEHRQHEARGFHRRIRDSMGELHIRLNHSLAAFTFVLIGCPISILLNRKDALQTFFVCFAPIIMFYYPSVILTFNVFKEGVSPESFIWGQMLIWMPAVVLLIAGLSAIHRALRS